MTRVLVAAASPVVRAGLETLVRASPSLLLVGASPGGTALAQQMEDLQPDVVLLTLDSNDESSLELLMLGTDPNAPAVVLVLDEPNRARTAEALRSGARAILPREAAATEIIAAVEAAAAGLVVLHPDAVDPLLPGPSSAAREPPPAPQQALTPREIEVLAMLAEGLGNKEIAWRLSISEHTVKFHISSIFTKLNATSRTEAVTLGIRQGLILI